MPSSSRLTELCRYHYDPLDRQAACTLTLLQPATLQRFYCTSRLATEIHGAVRTSLFQHDDQLLAQQRHQNDQLDTTLLATDQQRTVLSALDATRPHPLAYTPYGHRPPENGLLSLLGFNGQRPDPVTGHYHLGNGYRQFNPVLMRFNSPDSWSPFGEGGLNTYGYCGGDPRNRADPTGHMLKGLFNGFNKQFSLTSFPANQTKLIDLDEDIFIEISKYLSGSDMNNLRLVSKDIKRMIDPVSSHNFKTYLNKNAPHIFSPDKPASSLDKVIEVGLGRITGVSSSEASNHISVNMAKNLYDTHTVSTYSYNPTSLVTGNSIFFTRNQRAPVIRRHSISLAIDSEKQNFDRGWIREIFPDGSNRYIRRGSR